MSVLRPGTTVRLAATGREGKVVRLLGEGGQGSVYEVALADESTVAIKWYFAHAATARQRAALEALTERGAPGPRFLWPRELVTTEGSAGFGYAMDVRPSSWVGLADLLAGRVDAGLNAVCTIGLELADSFLALHNAGLCYRDVSFGNVFFEPPTGHVLICDNDNVGVDGASASTVLGTRRFMAPEVVRHEALPSTDTDLYSLAVLLFYLLFGGHPLLGRRELGVDVWDEAAERGLFGDHPLFVFDPVDLANAPDGIVHASLIRNWDFHPAFVRALFVQSFTEGLTNPRSGRVRESVFRATMARLRDLIVRCPGCGKENYFDVDRPHRPCWSCGRVVPVPVQLRIGRRLLVLNEGTTVTSHHLRLDYDFDTEVAQVRRHPQRPDRWGLTNRSAIVWRVNLPGRPPVDVAPERTVALVVGATIEFGPGIPPGVLVS